MSIADYTAILAIIGSVVTIFWAWRKSPAEIAHLQSQSQQATAEVLLKYMQALGTSGEQVKVLAQRVQALEEVTQAQECEIEKLRKENQAVRDWAARLVHQIQSLGYVPISYDAFEPKDKDKKK